MAPKKKLKNWQVKISEKARIFISILIVIFLIAFMLRLDVVAQMVSDLTGIPKDAIKNTASYITGLASGALLVTAGVVLAASVPFIAAGLAVVGAVIIVWTLINIYNDTNKNGNKINLG